MEPLWVGTAAAAGALGGLAVPALLRALPDPAPQVPVAADPAHRDLAARPGVRWGSVAAGLLAGALLGWEVPAPWPLVLWLVLLPAGLLLCVVDGHTRRLPKVVVLPATAIALLAIAAVELAAGRPEVLVRAVLGMLAARTVIWLLWFVHSAGMGFGDVRLTALLGLLLAHLGVGETVVGLYAAFLGFGVPGLLLALVRRDRRILRSAYPFGPFLIAGAVVGATVGGPVWRGLTGG